MLIQNICQNNRNNQIYTYKLIQNFQLHSKYLKEALRTIILVINDNQYLANKLGENIDLNMDFDYGEHQSESIRNVINIIINIKDNQNKLFGLNGDQQINFRSARNRKPMNLINYMLSLMKTDENFRNPSILDFFRKVSNVNGEGITANQELLYKFFDDKRIRKRLLMKMKMKDNKLYIHLDNTKDRIITLQDLELDESLLNKNPRLKITKKIFKKGDLITFQEYNYLREILCLYSDLALSRNYLWKTVLSDIFSAPLLFKEIWNQKLPIDLRSALTKLALSINIDQEPLNYKCVPLFTRTFDMIDQEDDKYDRDLGSLTESKVDRNDIDEKEFRNLSRNIQNFFSHYSDLMKAEWTGVKKQVKIDEKKKSQQSQQKQIKIKNYLDNILLLDMVKLFNFMLKYQVFDKLNQTYRYKCIFPFLVNFMEYSYRSPKLSYAIHYTRTKNYTIKRQHEKRKHFFKKIVFGIGAEVLGNLHDLGKFAQNALGIEGDEKDDGAMNIQMDDDLKYNNKIMRGLSSFLKKVDLMKDGKEKKNHQKLETDIKLEICDIIEYFIDLRQNYLITNFISWYRKLYEDLQEHYSPQLRRAEKMRRKRERKTKRQQVPVDVYNLMKKQPNFNEVFKTLIEEQLFTTMPNAMGTGISKIEFQDFEVSRKYFIQKGKKTIKGFYDYSKSKDFIPDLDCLLGYIPSLHCKKIAQDILPCLMMSFQEAEDLKVSAKMMECIVRLFNQRTEFLNNLMKLEILFDDTNKQIYEFLVRQVSRLRRLGNQSELWIEQFFEDPEQNDGEVMMIIGILKDMNTLMIRNSSLNTAGEPITPLFEEKDKENLEFVSKTRQKIFTDLKAHVPVIMLLRDVMHHLQRIIYEEEMFVQKEKMITIFSLVFKFLTKFCYLDAQNQNELYESFDLFIKHLHIDCKQMDLVAAIFQDNHELIEDIPDYIMEIFWTLIIDEGRQSRFLKFFAVIQHCNGIFNLNNQMKVLSRFIPHEEQFLENNCRILFVKKTNRCANLKLDFPAGAQLKLIPFELRASSEDFVDTHLDESYIYHKELIDILILFRC